MLEHIRDDDTVKTIPCDDEGDELVGVPPSQVTIATASSNETSSNNTRVGNPHRKGHSFCGYCCDMRRAVIIVNIINIVKSVLLSTTVGIAAALRSSDSEDEYFEHVVEDVEGVPHGDHGNTTLTELDEGTDFDEDAFWRTMQLFVFVTSAIALVCSSLGIVGGIRYSQWMILCPAVWYCMMFGINMWAVSFMGVILNGLFVYPHIMFLHEVRQGIMTRDRYKLEQHSCCCL